MTQKPFDPIRLLKELSSELLRELFVHEGIDDFLLRRDSAGNEPGVVHSDWDSLSDVDREKLYVSLPEIHALSHEAGLRVLAEQLEWICPENVSEFQAIESRADKVLWAWLYARDAFEEAAIFVRADTLAAGRYWKRWNGLPPKPITVTDEQTSRLQDALRDYYWPRELRGQYCRVHHYSRCNGIDYFFAYLDDWPDRTLVFDLRGQMESRSERFAFTNIFAYDPAHGCIDLLAKGGRSVHLKLRELFCRSVLKLEVEDEKPLMPAYQLNSLLADDLALPTDPADGIAAVRISRIRIAPKGGDRPVRYEEIGFHQDATLTIVRNELNRLLRHLNLSRDQVTVSEAAFQLHFQSSGRSRARTMSFYVSSPNSCDLKSKSEEMRAIGERCLRNWRILND
jgi:hypothetical protein